MKDSSFADAWLAAELSRGKDGKTDMGKALISTVGLKGEVTADDWLMLKTVEMFDEDKPAHHIRTRLF